MSDLNPFINPYRHPKNIAVGEGRIMWGSKARPILKFDDEGNPLRGVLSEGWVLPGGKRTKSSSEAISAATWIDQNAHVGLAQRL